MIIGRLILGFVAGNNSSSISIYVREFSPKKDAAITGSISPLLLNVSIVVVYLLGFMLPSSSEFEQNNYEYNDEVTWRFVLGFPIITSLIRILGLLFVFKQEIPSVMIHEHYRDELENYFRSIYTPEDWHNVLEEIERDV